VPKICQGQPPTFGSQCSKCHTNWFTFGGVIAVLLGHRVFAIFAFGQITSTGLPHHGRLPCLPVNISGTESVQCTQTDSSHPASSASTTITPHTSAFTLYSTHSTHRTSSLYICHNRLHHYNQFFLTSTLYTAS